VPAACLNLDQDRADIRPGRPKQPASQAFQALPVNALQCRIVPTGWKLVGYKYAFIGMQCRLEEPNGNRMRYAQTAAGVFRIVKMLEPVGGERKGMLRAALRQVNLSAAHHNQG
jgi:hypothetical protein